MHRACASLHPANARLHHSSANRQHAGANSNHSCASVHRRNARLHQAYGRLHRLCVIKQKAKHIRIESLRIALGAILFRIALRQIGIAVTLDVFAGAKLLTRVYPAGSMVSAPTI